MNYFKYQCQSSLGKIWPLFKEMKDANVDYLSGRESEFSHTSEILNSAINGNICYENFNLRAYEYRCSENDKNMAYKSGSKVLSIVSSEDIENNTKAKSFTVAEEVLGFQQEEYENIEEDLEFQVNFENLLKLKEGFMIREGIDPISMLKNAVMGVPSAISTLKEIADDDVKNVIYSLCEAGKGRLQRYLEQYV